MNEELLREWLAQIGPSATNAIRIEALFNLGFDLALAFGALFGGRWCIRRFRSRNEGDDERLFLGGMTLACAFFVAIGMLEAGQALAAFLYPEYWALRMLLR